MKAKRILLAGTLTSCVLLGGCGEGGPTAPTTNVVPTPAPIPNVAGSWQGTFRPGSPSALCGNDAPATATFTQDGERVSGRVTTNGVPQVFEGEFRGAQLNGTLRTGGSAVTVTGTASASNMTLTLLTGTFFCPNNARIALFR